MSWWRVRNPGSFPPDFHRAMRQGAGNDKLVMQFFTKMKAERMKKEWLVFRYSLRAHAGDPSYGNEVELMHRTKVRFNHDSGMWELLLTSHKRAFEDIESIE